MAYDKIIPVKRRLDHCVNYVLNPEKTDLGAVLEYIGNPDKTITPDGRAVLETAINCQLETAYQEMQETKKRWSKKGGVLGYHLVHSYAPGEVTPEQAHSIGVEFAGKLLQGRYEAVISTHLDHDHIHNHILFNSVSCVDGKKYRDNFKAYFGDIRGASNEVSRKHGLSVIDPKGRGKHYAEWNAERQGKQTIRGLVRQDIDAVVEQSFTYASFLAGLRKRGYEIKSGSHVTHTAVKPPGGTRFIRLGSLGEGYTEEDIKKRLSATRSGSATGIQAQTQRTLPKRYTYRSGTVPRRKQKLRGFRALYVHYLFFLGLQKPGSKRKCIPFSIRSEVTKLHRYQAQFSLLQRYRIETDSELSMLKDALQAEIDALTGQRKTLYQQRNRGEEVSGEISIITEKLRQLRRQVKLCENIAGDAYRIKAQLQDNVQEEKEAAKTKQRKYERGK
jgi:hypothetical protein